MHNFDLLNQISSNTEIKKSLDDFIKNMHLQYNSNYRSQTGEAIKIFFEDELVKLNNLVSNLSMDNDFNSSDLKLYIKLDKIIIPIMNSYISFGLNDRFIIPNSGNRYISEFDGSNIQDLYNYDYSDFTLDLEANANLFPESTKKYLLKKKDDRETGSFDSLENEFQTRIYLSRFDDKFRIGKFRTALKSFVKKCDQKTLKNTLLFLHDGIHKKYSTEPKNVELMNKFLGELVSELYRGHIWYLYRMDSDTTKQLEPLMSKPVLSDSFVRSLINEGPDSLSILSFYLASEELKESADEFILSALFKESYDALVNIAELPSELKAKLLEQAKIQFLKKYSHMRNFLLKHGKITETEAKV